MASQNADNQPSDHKDADGLLPLVPEFPFPQDMSQVFIPRYVYIVNQLNILGPQSVLTTGDNPARETVITKILEVNIAAIEANNYAGRTVCELQTKPQGTSMLNDMLRLDAQQHMREHLRKLNNKGELFHQEFETEDGGTLRVWVEKAELHHD